MNPDSLQRFLRRAANNGVYHLPTSGVDAIRDAALAEDMAYYHCDLKTIVQATDAPPLLGHAFGFPKGFGDNFDAVLDCLTDLSWQNTTTTVIIISGTDALCSCDPEGWAKLLAVFGSAAEFWRNEDSPFWVFIDMSADGIAQLPTLT